MSVGGLVSTRQGVFGIIILVLDFGVKFIDGRPSRGKSAVNEHLWSLAPVLGLIQALVQIKGLEGSSRAERFHRHCTGSTQCSTGTIGRPSGPIPVLGTIPPALQGEDVVDGLL